VILPIYRNDDERSEVLSFCETLKQELVAQRFADDPVRVRMDDRDIRGGEKKWQWVKRGVPLRVEVGPRDIAEGKLSAGRRDVSGRPDPTPRDQFVANISDTLTAMQKSLFDRAAAAREEASVMIDTLDEFETFFAESAPGGLAYCHFVDGPEMGAKLKQLKVTARCVPVDGPEEPGKCLFTGQPSSRRGVFARAY
jgi:prolyl-tRNA synthetase